MWAPETQLFSCPLILVSTAAGGFCWPRLPTMFAVTHLFFFFIEELPDGVLESDDDEDEDDEVS